MIKKLIHNPFKYKTYNNLINISFKDLKSELGKIGSITEKPREKTHNYLGSSPTRGTDEPII